MTQPPPSAPSTPTPRRFPLASKRPPPPPPPPQQSQQQTPGGKNPVFASSQRFQATPRFAAPSSAQRQPSTPFFSSTQRRPRRRESILDALDSSPPDAPTTATRATGTQRLSESIDIDSDVASDLQGTEDEQEEEDEEEEEEEEGVLRPIGLGVSDSIEVDESDASSDTRVGLDERTPKRRRISISPIPSWHHVVGDGIAESSLREEEKEEDDDLPRRNMSEDEEMLPDANQEIYSGAGESGLDNDDGDGVADLPDPNEGIPVKSQPAFHQAPRFKMSETEPSPQEGLPEAFSPQRRGPKYLAGGLAAELQSWLAAAKGWGGAGGDRPANLVMRIEVDELRLGNRMYLVRGRRIVEESGAREELAARLMLAGEGRLTGLGQKAPVIVGSLVAVSQPAWDVVLEGVTWTVACDWVVVDS